MEQKKTLWHSELCALGEIDVVIQSEVTPSKFAGKSPWVAMHVQGRERYYSCENEQCADRLTGLKGKTVHLMATGSREDADIQLMNSSQGAPDKPGQTTHSSQGAPARSAESSRPKAFAQEAHDVFKIAWELAGDLMTLIPEKDATELPLDKWYDLKLRITQFIAIQTQRSL